MYRFLRWMGIVAMASLFGVGFDSVCRAQRADSDPQNGEGPATERIDYSRQVKPIFQSRCYACHGAVKREAGLRLDAGVLARQGSDNGQVLNLGAPDASELIARVTSSDREFRMPPDGEPLAPEQVKNLLTWISQGADSPADEQPERDPRLHWSFQPLKRPQIPTARRPAAAVNPIDAFLEQGLARQGITAQPLAPKLIQLRRLYLDLIGLPATYSQLREFLNDDSLDGYERVVDRLLNDPRHGERWARHWMDVWRYSDWWGLGDQLRNSQKHIWHWRDWIVESLNEDVPYDEMVRQMLAADELYPNDLGKLRASGFLARNYFLFNRHQWMDEVVEHVGKGLLGLTMNCAKCHDHKYDPITQVDYYRMRAFFEPYHVRLDMLPGESDLSQDGVPRAYDGLLETPTYRFERGQENQPDKSVVISSGVPEILALDNFNIQPVSLPMEAWQPERRTWVLDAHIAKAQKAVAAAVARLSQLRQQPAKERRDASGKSEANDATADAAQDLELANLSLAVAQAELASVQQRAAAMRAAWTKLDARADGNSSELEQSQREAARAAARAERAATVEKARYSLAEAERQAQRAAPGKKEPSEKKVDDARKSLDKALKELDEVTEQFSKVAGAAWTPTRFFSSTADDPTIAFPPTSSGRRSALAKWITDTRNPLTARVAVNQIWMRHFGAPLAPDVFDVGRKATPPRNPELLDWLACELLESGWSMKHIHRLIVTSMAYRMSSSTHGAQENVTRDPDNHWLWRRAPIRLESQVIRDSILSLAGVLDSTMGGRSILPADQVDSVRRSLYFFHSDNERNLFLTEFDEALVKECYKRDQSILPQQALALTNSRLILDSAPNIARQIDEATDTAPTHPSRTERDDESAFISRAFAVLLGIEVGEAEIAACRRALASWRTMDDASESDSRAKLIWALLNHNDFVTLR